MWRTGSFRPQIPDAPLISTHRLENLHALRCYDMKPLSPEQRLAFEERLEHLNVFYVRRTDSIMVGEPYVDITDATIDLTLNETVASMVKQPRLSFVEQPHNQRPTIR